MKHNTHIYIAAKAIDFTGMSSKNFFKPDGSPLLLNPQEKAKETIDAKKRQRILRSHEDSITEASWAPDDILKDNHPYHVFKLIATDEFDNIPDKYKKYKFKHNDLTLYRYNGGLPYKIDHLANDIIDMYKLRNFNDQFGLRQIMYMYLLLSHYVVDAHVPMHCDHRDDPPSNGGTGLDGAYMSSTAHGNLEILWDKATTPVALSEKIIEPEMAADMKEETSYSEKVTFKLTDCEEGGRIKVPLIERYKLMDYMIGVCIQSKMRCRELFPVDNPSELDDTDLPQITENIFANAIGNLMGIWRYIWVLSTRPEDLPYTN